MKRCAARVVCRLQTVCAFQVTGRKWYGADDSLRPQKIAASESQRSARPGFGRTTELGPEDPGAFPNPAAAQLRQPDLSRGNQDGLTHISPGVRGYLKQHSIPHELHVNGHRHDAPEWKCKFYDFVPRFFVEPSQVPQ